MAKCLEGFVKIADRFAFGELVAEDLYIERDKLVNKLRRTTSANVQQVKKRPCRASDDQQDEAKDDEDTHLPPMCHLLALATQ